MTNDSRLFSPRPRWEAKGYRPDEYSRWLLGDWRPIEELWEALGVEPSCPEPTEIELEDWLFDATASPERREAEAQFVHGHLLKPGDVARTDWRLRCAQPPYDQLPIPRAKIPPGIILSRDADAWIRENEIKDVALPLYQGIMVQPFVPSARGWISGTGLRAKWDYSDPGNLRWNPQYLMASSDVRVRRPNGAIHPLKIGFRDISRDSDVRSFIGALLPDFPCGNSAPVLYRDGGTQSLEPLMAAFLNSFVFDWQIRRRGGAAHLNWYMLADMAVPFPDFMSATRSVTSIISRLNLHPAACAPAVVATGLDRLGALNPGERSRLRPTVDAIVAAIYGCGAGEFAHVLQDADLDSIILGRGNRDLDVRGFWRVDRDKDPELRHTVLTLVAFHDLESKIEAAGGDREKGIEDFLTQNHGEGWMLPETLRLADYGLGHDERARHPQRCREPPRPTLLRLAACAERRGILARMPPARPELPWCPRVRPAPRRSLIERRAADGEDYLDLLTDGFTRKLLGDDGYLTVLLEIRARSVVDEDTYWATIGATPQWRPPGRYRLRSTPRRAPRPRPPRRSRLPPTTPLHPPVPVRRTLVAGSRRAGRVPSNHSSGLTRSRTCSNDPRHC